MSNKLDLKREGQVPLQFNYMSRSQNIYLINLEPKNRPLGLQKVKNDPKIKSNSKFRIEGIIED